MENIILLHGTSHIIEKPDHLFENPNNDYGKGFYCTEILEMAKEWVKKESLTIETADAEALTKYFIANAKDLLDKGVKIEKVSGHEAAFSIIPADGSYKVSFGEDEFVAFFKEFLRPQLIEMLF